MNAGYEAAQQEQFLAGRKPVIGPWETDAICEYGTGQCLVRSRIPRLTEGSIPK